MKRRSGPSFERAITQILTEIGVDAAAASVGKSTSLVRKWSDPDHRATPSLQQAVKLDLAYIDLTKKPGPIFAAYAASIEPDGDGVRDREASLLRSFLRLQAIVGETARYLCDSPIAARQGGVVLRNSEASSLLALAAEVDLAAGDFARAAKNTPARVFDAHDCLALT